MIKTKQIMHFSVEVEKYGEIRIKSLCNRSRSDVVSISNIDSGQNVTDNKNEVTCSFCKRILKAKEKKD